jgi:UrcA family protein
MNTITEESVRIGLLAALLGGLATGGMAADLPQVHVKYADLNIDTPAGAARLYQRIRGAAIAVCPAFDARNLAGRAAVEACRTRAIADAVAAVHNPSLTRVYERQTGATSAAQLASAR